MPKKRCHSRGLQTYVGATICLLASGITVQGCQTYSGNLQSCIFNLFQYFMRLPAKGRLPNLQLFLYLGNSQKETAVAETESKYKNMKTYHDLADDGDGGSNVMQQVLSQKAKIKNNLAGIKHILAIASGKGGVGKSTLSMQLAIALQRTGNQVAILDADFNGPSQARLAGLMDAMFIPGVHGFDIPRTKLGLKVLSFGTLIPESQNLEFNNVSPSDSHIWRATKEFTSLSEILGSANWGELDYLVIDLPPGTERCFQYAEFLGEETKFILVTIPSDLSQGVVNRSHTALKKAGANILGVIENMAGYYCHDCKEIKPLFPENDQKILELELLGKLPFDPKIAENCDKGLLENTFEGSITEEPLKHITDKLISLMNET